MERHSALLSQLASKERQSREKQEQLVKLASQAEKARQDAIASLQQQTEALKQTYRVRKGHFLISQWELVIEAAPIPTMASSNVKIMSGSSDLGCHCVLTNKNNRFVLIF